eukprot:scpid63665/ scgid6108/ 
MDNEDENSTELNALREEYAHHERNNARCRALLDHNRPLLTRSMCWRSVLEGMIGHKDGIDAGSDAKQKIEAPPIENERRRLLVEYVRAKGTVETFQLFVRQLAQPGVNGEIALKLARGNCIARVVIAVLVLHGTGCAVAVRPVARCMER